MQQITDLERTKILHNGEKFKGTFSKAEMDRRNTNLRNYMAQKESMLYYSLLITTLTIIAISYLHLSTEIMD